MSTAIPTSQLHEETIRFADLLAKNARLDNCLPADTDFTPEEMRRLQEQLNALEAIPKDQQSLFFLALSAKHLPALVSAVRSTSRETQNQAFSSYVQLLSLLPDPDKNPYFRKYIVSPEFAPLPTLVASAFVEGIQWLRPSGPGYVCSLIMHMLQWCDTSIGDDKRASIDKAVRLALREKCRELMGSGGWGDLDRYQQVEIQRLEGMLGPVEHMPTPPDQPGYYLQSSKDYLEGKIPGLYECNVCMDDDAPLQCSRCKSVKYCGKECQNKDWKKGHKLRCYEMVF
ncbi:hypothetical protein K466DRAFT_602169 [Polyporus arcularius HHB13444]|uniref:MYND-type domain-containing protein n=1 Tax=Polyporus arcularius HHB13444 TaxID=1314778 RepID=A0A5C3P6L9_9APHY|nr:hypothetical protein K466DRAFT_602169 [Polyporus arcularius HHB13444]